MPFNNSTCVNNFQLFQVRCTHGQWQARQHCMMMSSNGNFFHITGLLRREATSQQRSPHTKASDAELWCFLWSTLEPTVEQTLETPVIWDAIRSVWCNCNGTHVAITTANMRNENWEFLTDILQIIDRGYETPSAHYDAIVMAHTCCNHNANMRNENWRFWQTFCKLLTEDTSPHIWCI